MVGSLVWKWKSKNFNKSIHEHREASMAWIQLSNFKKIKFSFFFLD